ncbi:MAG TPA: HEAT repeat domain-containing protein [Pirellulales bacterium]
MRQGTWAAVAIAVSFLFTAPSASAAWPPTSDATPTEIVDSLLREVGLIALHDRDPARRAWAWRALGAVRDPRAVSLLNTAMSDPSPEVRREAIHSVQHAVDRKAGDAVRRATVAALDDPDLSVRLAAADNLSSGRFQDWRGLGLGARLRDESPEIRDACLSCLYLREATHGELVEGVAAAIALGSPEVQLWVLGSRFSPLRYLTEDERSAAVATALKSPLPDVRVAAITGGARDFPTAAKRLLDDPDPAVRRALFDAERLQLIDDSLRSKAYLDGLPSWLKRGVEDPDPSVVEAAIQASVRYSKPIPIDIGAFSLNLPEATLGRADHGAAAWWLAEAFGRPIEARLGGGRAVLDSFKSAAVGSPERRLAMRRLAQYLRWEMRAMVLVDDIRRLRWGKRTVFIPGVNTQLAYVADLEEEQRYRDALYRVGMPLAVEIVRELPAALTDPDPNVRWAAAVAARWSWLWICYRRWPDENAPTKLAETMLALWPESEAATRGEFAAALAWIALQPRSRDRIHRALDAALPRLISDPDPAIARTVALACGQPYFPSWTNFYGGPEPAENGVPHWTPSAAPILKSVVADADAAEHRSDDWRHAAATLSTRAPDALPLQGLITAAIGKHAPYATEHHDRVTMGYIFQTHALDRLLAAVEKLPADERSAAGVHLGQAIADYPDDQRDKLFTFLERTTKAPDVFSDALLDTLLQWAIDPRPYTTDPKEPAEIELRKKRRDATVARIRQWANDTMKPVLPGMPYAALHRLARRDGSEFLSFLGSDDPIAAALTLGEAASSWRADEPFKVEAHAPLRVRVLVEEAGRRAKQWSSPSDVDSGL